MQKYAFFDRDGTIIWEPEVFPLASMEQFAFMDGAKEGMQLLTNKGYKLVMVTNQPLLGTPEHPRELFDQVMLRIEQELAEVGVQFEFIMVCTHAADKGCNCRKPLTGGLKVFLKQKKGSIDLKNSLVFGNMEADKGLAENLGVRFVRVETNQRFVLPEDL